MRMMTMTIVTAIMLGGCASARDTMFYEKPGVSEEQMRADEAACTRAALDTAGQRGAAFLSCDRDTLVARRRASGYRRSGPERRLYGHGGQGSAGDGRLDKL